MELERLVHDAAARRLERHERTALAAALANTDEVKVSDLDVLAALGGGRQQLTGEEHTKLLEAVLAQQPRARRPWVPILVIAATLLLSVVAWLRVNAPEDRVKSGLHRGQLFMVAQRPGAPVGHTVTSPVKLEDDEVVRLVLRQTEPRFVGLYEVRAGQLELVWTAHLEAGDRALGPEGQGFRPDQAGMTRYWLITAPASLPPKLDTAECDGCEAQVIELIR